MNVNPNKVPALLRARFKVEGVEVRLKDPTNTQLSSITQGLETVVLYGYLSLEHVTPGVTPVQLDEPTHEAKRIIDQWLIDNTLPFTHRNPAMVITLTLLEYEALPR